MSTNVNKFCPERIEEILEDKDSSSEEYNKSLNDLAELVKFKGFKRLEDTVKYKNNLDQKTFDAIDLMDEKYGLKAMLLSTKRNTRNELITYLKDIAKDAEKTKKEGG